MSDTIGQFAGMSLQRTKTWPERNADEKLEALREEVRTLIFRLAEAEALIAKLRLHSHSPSGDIVVYLKHHPEHLISYHPLRVPIGLRDSEGDMP